MSFLTIFDIGLAQWEDLDIRLILNFLKSPIETEESKLFFSSPGVKSYWINKQMFFLDKHGVLRNTKKKDGLLRKFKINRISRSSHCASPISPMVKPWKAIPSSSDIAVLWIIPPDVTAIIK
jgi:hypothetical protein